jgi:histidyl-tRNA synthetase
VSKPNALQPVRGTRDLLPDESRRHRLVEDTAFEIAGRYGFGEIVTPIFEFTEVFARTLGETSDVVTKEMYTFTDRSGDSITLRPEGTAGVARALISNGLAQSLPLKLFYRGPMFRHERPQKGRLRQFNQIGVELLGVATPQADIEVIALGAHILAALGIGAKATLEINSLGTPNDRRNYVETLRNFLSGHAASLSEDSRNRLERNPLRILDSKDEGDQAILVNAPLITECLIEGRAHFDAVLAGLQALEVGYTINPRLVRGLDYYGHTAFEFTTTALGAQGTVLAGGRYDGLIEDMGGPPTPGIGWAAGIERLAMLIETAPALRRPLTIIPTGAADQALTLAERLRRAGFSVELGYSGNMKKRFERANKLGARAAIILGEDEWAKGAVAVRDLDSGHQDEVALGGLEDYLARFR